MKKKKPEFWKPEHFDTSYGNNYLEEVATEILKEVKEVSNWEVMRGNEEGIIRSLPIKIDNFGLIFGQIKMAKRYLNEVIRCLKIMGFEISIKSVKWHNVPDSCQNIVGDIGFFAVRFNFKKVKK